MRGGRHDGVPLPCHALLLSACLLLAPRCATAAPCPVSEMQKHARLLGATISTNCAGVTEVAPATLCKLTRPDSICDETTCQDSGAFVPIVSDDQEATNLPGCFDKATTLTVNLQWMSSWNESALEWHRISSYIVDTMLAGTQITRDTAVTQRVVDDRFEWRLPLHSVGLYTPHQMRSLVESRFKAESSDPASVFSTKWGGATASLVKVFHTHTEYPSTATPVPETPAPPSDDVPTGLIALMVGGTIFFLVFFLGMRCYLKHQKEAKASAEAQRSLVEDNEMREREQQQQQQAGLQGVGSSGSAAGGGAAAEVHDPEAVQQASIKEAPRKNITTRPLTPTLSPLPAASPPPMWGDPSVDSSNFTPFGKGMGKLRVVESDRV